MVIKNILYGLIIGLLLVGSTVAQDTSLVGINEGDVITYKLVENTVTDETGEVDPFALGSFGAGAVEVGETFTITIDSIDGSDYEYTATSPDEEDFSGSESMSELGSYAIHTDWDFWTDEANADFADLGGAGGTVTIDDGTDSVSLEYKVSILFNITISLEYDKDTGVLNGFSTVFDLVELDPDTFEFIPAGTETLTIEREGDIQAEGGSVPFSNVGIIVALLAVPVVSKLKRNK